jgi:hypothetical protein
MVPGHGQRIIQGFLVSRFLRNSAGLNGYDGPRVSLKPGDWRRRCGNEWTRKDPSGDVLSLDSEEIEGSFSASLQSTYTSKFLLEDKRLWQTGRHESRPSSFVLDHCSES